MNASIFILCSFSVSAVACERVILVMSAIMIILWFFFAEVACERVEGGMYISPEFQLGQVYDGTFDIQDEEEDIILYRPVYVCVPSDNTEANNHNALASKPLSSSSSASNALVASTAAGKTATTNNHPNNSNAAAVATTASLADTTSPSSSLLTRELMSEKCTSV